MLKLDTNVGVVCLGVVSVVLAFFYAELPSTHFWDSIYLTVLQVLSSVGLIIGVYSQTHLFFLPWMALTSFCIFSFSQYILYMMIIFDKKWEGIWIFVSIVGIFCLALYSVTQAFNRIRNSRISLGFIDVV